MGNACCSCAEGAEKEGEDIPNDTIKSFEEKTKKPESCTGPDQNKAGKNSSCPAGGDFVSENVVKPKMDSQHGPVNKNQDWRIDPTSDNIKVDNKEIITPVIRNKAKFTNGEHPSGLKVNLKDQHNSSIEDQDESNPLYDAKGHIKQKTGKPQDNAVDDRYNGDMRDYVGIGQKPISLIKVGRKNTDSDKVSDSERLKLMDGVKGSEKHSKGGKSSDKAKRVDDKNPVEDDYNYDSTKLKDGVNKLNPISGTGSNMGLKGDNKPNDLRVEINKKLNFISNGEDDLNPYMISKNEKTRNAKKAEDSKLMHNKKQLSKGKKKLKNKGVDSDLEDIDLSDDTKPKGILKEESKGKPNGQMRIDISDLSEDNMDSKPHEVKEMNGIQSHKNLFKSRTGKERDLSPENNNKEDQALIGFVKVAKTQSKAIGNKKESLDVDAEVNEDKVKPKVGGKHSTSLKKSKKHSKQLGKKKGQKEPLDLDEESDNEEIKEHTGGKPSKKRSKTQPKATKEKIVIEDSLDGSLESDEEVKKGSKPAKKRVGSTKKSKKDSKVLNKKEGVSIGIENDSDNEEGPGIRMTSMNPRTSNEVVNVDENQKPKQKQSKAIKKDQGEDSLEVNDEPNDEESEDNVGIAKKFDTAKHIDSTIKSKKNPEGKVHLDLDEASGEDKDDIEKLKTIKKHTGSTKKSKKNAKTLNKKQGVKAPLNINDESDNEGKEDSDIIRLTNKNLGGKKKLSKVDKKDQDDNSLDIDNDESNDEEDKDDVKTKSKATGKRTNSTKKSKKDSKAPSKKKVPLHIKDESDNEDNAIKLANKNSYTDNKHINELAIQTKIGEKNPNDEDSLDDVDKEDNEDGEDDKGNVKSKSKVTGKRNTSVKKLKKGPKVLNKKKGAKSPLRIDESDDAIKAANNKPRTNGKFGEVNTQYKIDKKNNDDEDSLGDEESDNEQGKIKTVGKHNSSDKKGSKDNKSEKKPLNVNDELNSDDEQADEDNDDINKKQGSTKNQFNVTKTKTRLIKSPERNKPSLGNKEDQIAKHKQESHPAKKRTKSAKKTPRTNQKKQSEKKPLKLDDEKPSGKLIKKDKAANVNEENPSDIDDDEVKIDEFDKRSDSLKKKLKKAKTDKDDKAIEESDKIRLKKTKVGSKDSEPTKITLKKRVKNIKTTHKQKRTLNNDNESDNEDDENIEENKKETNVIEKGSGSVKRNLNLKITKEQDQSNVKEKPQTNKNTVIKKPQVVVSTEKAKQLRGILKKKEDAIKSPDANNEEETNDRNRMNDIIANERAGSSKKKPKKHHRLFSDNRSQKLILNNNNSKPKSKIPTKSTTKLELNRKHNGNMKTYKSISGLSDNELDSENTNREVTNTKINSNRQRRRKALDSSGKGLNASFNDLAVIKINGILGNERRINDLESFDEMLQDFYQTPQAPSRGLAPRSIAEAVRMVKGNNIKRSLSVNPLQIYPRRVEDFVSKEILNADNDHMPLYEGVVWRYMPGFVKHFHPKYCLLTKSAFFYFENKLRAFRENPKPLASISLSSIESVQRVKVTIPEEKQIINQQKKSSAFNYAPTSVLPRFQFEIFLKKGAATIPPEEEKEASNILLANENSKDSEIAQSFSELKDKPHVVSTNLPSSSKSIGATKDDRYIVSYTVSKPGQSGQQKHLMRKPSIIDKVTVDVTSTCNPASINSKYLEAKNEDVVTKWTYREINWYLAEDRLLFASDDELEVHKWNLLFQWLLGRNNQ